MVCSNVSFTDLDGGLFQRTTKLVDGNLSERPAHCFSTVVCLFVPLTARLQVPSCQPLWPGSVCPELCMVDMLRRKQDNYLRYAVTPEELETLRQVFKLVDGWFDSKQVYPEIEKDKGEKARMLLQKAKNMKRSIEKREAFAG